jgi:hypothetical protein
MAHFLFEDFKIGMEIIDEMNVLTKDVRISFEILNACALWLDVR